MKKTKAQAFIQDIVIAVFILSIIIMIYFNFYTNQDVAGEFTYQNVLSETKTISDYLLSAGYPENWNETNVVRLGITDDHNILDLNKLDAFYNMTSSDYDKTRSLLKTKYDYLFFFKDYDGNILNITGEQFFGKPGFNNTNIESENPTYMAKVRRFVVEKQGAVNITAYMREMIIYVWSKEKQ